MSALLAQLNRPVPIVLAPTGMVPTKAMTPHVPVTPAEIEAFKKDIAGLLQVTQASDSFHKVSLRLEFQIQVKALESTSNLTRPQINVCAGSSLSVSEDVFVLMA